eukprot:7762526-Ditylum_brightwellii.AAC.1
MELDDMITSKKDIVNEEKMQSRLERRRINLIPGMHQRFVLLLRVPVVEQSIQFVRCLRFLESGSYVCGNKLKGGVSNKNYGWRVLQCMDPIESEYYTPAEGSAGERVLTEAVCASCYEDQ